MNQSADLYSKLCWPGDQKLSSSSHVSCLVIYPVNHRGLPFYSGPPCYCFTMFCILQNASEIFWSMLKICIIYYTCRLQRFYSGPPWHGFHRLFMYYICVFPGDRDFEFYSGPLCYSQVFPSFYILQRIILSMSFT